MKKIILSIVITFSIVNNLYSMDVNNNNNNNQRSELPNEIWKNEIISRFVYPILKAETLPELKAALKEILKLSLISKKYAGIVKDLLNEKKIIINGKKITLKELYSHRKNEIIQDIKNKLSVYFSCEWFSDINSGRMALIKAAKGCRIRLIKLLLKNGANINARDFDGCSAIKHVIFSDYLYLKESKRIKTLKILILNGVDLKDLNFIYNGYTPLLWAVEQGWKEMVEFLISYGVDLNAENVFGLTALDLARSKFYFADNNKALYNEIVELLEKAKTETTQNLNNQNNNNNEYCGKRHECIVQ